MPIRFGLAYQDWPVADREAWQDATATADFFDDTPVAAHWRPKTAYQGMTAYGRWLAFVQQRAPALLLEPAEARTSSALLHDYIDALAARLSASGIVAEINHPRHVLRAVAPKLDQRLLRKQQQRWSKRVRAPDNRATMVDGQTLYALGKSLMQRAREDTSARSGARDFRDGLLIALLTARPLRRATLTQLELDTNLVREGSGWAILIQSNIIKSNEPLEFSVPDDLVLDVNDYLNIYRPRFLGADRHRSLWPSSKGGRLGAEAIYDVVCRHTRTALGSAIPPHVFRSVAATTIVRRAPSRILAARDLLGHSRVDTTDAYYRRSRSIDASRKHNEALAALRKK